MLDDSTPYVRARWLGCLLLVVVYLGRILFLQVVEKETSAANTWIV